MDEIFNSEEFGHIMEENGITVENVFELTPEIIKELFPKIGTRLKFLKIFNLEKRKLTVTNPSELTTDSTLDSIQIDTPIIINLNEDVENIDRMSLQLEDCENKDIDNFPDFDLKTLLSTSPLGKSIVKYYFTNNSLDSIRRRRLTDIIIKHIFNYVIKHRLKHQEYNIITSKIIALFPSESAATYYVPAIRKRHSGTGRPILAKGKLVDKCRNLLHSCSDVIAERKRSLSEPIDVITKQQRVESISEDIQNDIIWLKNRSEPWAQVMIKWNNTFIARQNTNLATVEQFIEEWPILKDLRADILITLDFDKLYPESSLKLILNWEHFFQNILLLKRSNVKDNYTLELLSLIESDISEESRFIVQLLGICYLIPPKGRLQVEKTHWKFSTIESAEAIICHAKNAGDIENIITLQKEKASVHKQTVQPYIIVEGPTLTEINSSYIIIDKIRYQLDSPRRAFDICFQLFHVLNAKYPPAGEHIYLLIQKGIYGINLKNDKVIPYIMDILEQTRKNNLML